MYFRLIHEILKLKFKPMKKLLILFTLFFISYTANSQVFWTEDFDGTACAAGSGCDPNIVNWTISIQGAEGATPNTWFVSDTESGMPAGQCGAANQNDQSLHVGNIAGSTGSILCPNGDCGAAYDDSSPAEVTNKRVESPVIDCSGQTGITADFNYIENGEGSNDDATFLYFDGATWSQIDPLAKTPGGCAPQGQWTAISVALPASADNNPNVKIGFLWVNDGNGVASDPSFAVDDITLSSTSVTPSIEASFTPDVQTLCEGDCVTFVDNSSTTDAGGLTSWDWTFNGGTPNTFSGQNPPCIDYNTPGTYSVELTVTDAGANTDDTITIATYITVEAAPDAGTNGAVTFCDTDPSSDLFNELGGTPAAGGSWSPAMASGTGVFDPAVDAPGTYIYTVTSGNSCPDATAEVDVTVNSCSTPTASFTASTQTICAGDCVTFNDISNGPNPIVDWNWTFAGGTPNSFNGQNPGCVTYNTPGTYQVELSITDNGGLTDDTLTVAAYITVEAPPSAGVDAVVQYCDNDPVTDLFTELGGSPDAGGSWSPAMASGTGNFDPAVDPSGTYTYTVTSTNSCPDATADVQVTVNNCNQPVAGFTTPSQTICQGDCIIFTDISTGTNVSSWEWDFGTGASPATFSGQNPPTVCFNLAGNVTVTLTITDDVGTDDMTMSITVNPAPIPEITQNPDQCDGNTVTLTTGATGNHTWSDNSTNTTLDVSSSGTYWVEVDDGSGCIGTDTIDMVFHEQLELDITAVPETCIDAEDGTVEIDILQGDGPLYFSWLNGDTSSNPSFAPGIYTVNVTNDYGCTWLDTVTIDAGVEECPEPSIYIPNIFSPNGDGINDYFEVYGQDISSIAIHIFDRWGKLVFYSTDVNAQWDGTRNGKPMNTAVFAYFIDVTFVDGIREEYKGNLTLVRKK